MLDARIAALALAAALAVPAAPHPAASSIGEPAAVRVLPVGPPLICFPLDIGGAASLPFVSEGFEVKTTMAPDEIAKSLCSLLAASDDVVVHMETLRRAAVWLMSLESEGRGATDPQHQNAAKIQALLTDELLLAASASGDAKVAGASRDTKVTGAGGDAKVDASISTRQLALRWFDLGYFLSAAGQARVIDSGRAQTWLERAVRMVPDDPALRFGVALAEFDFRSDGSGTNWARHLVCLFDEPKGAPAAAVPANSANSANLRKNVLATFGLFLKQQDWDKLGAEVRKQSGRS